MIGRTLGHYEIQDILGEGGMGAVYLAEDQRLHRKVALKVLPADMASAPERIERFEREAKVVARLNHPNIVTLFSVEEADGLKFLTMELVEGQTLEEMIPEEGFTLREFLRLALPLTEALSAAHVKGIVHRDLKPANVMVTEEGRLKVLDFGVAKLQGSASEELGKAAETLTKEGSIVGTVAYLSPEQVRGEVPDHRSDLFALGIVLYQMLTGDKPFAADSPLEVVSSILRDTPKPVTEVKVKLPHRLGEIIEKCLEKEPDGRYQTALELHDDLASMQRLLDTGELDRTLADVTGADLVGQAGTSSAPTPRWLPIAGGLAALLVAVAVLAFFAIGRKPEAPEQALPEVRERAVAVVPLQELGEAPDAFFAAGLADALAGRLTEIGGLDVVARGRVQQAIAGGVSAEEVGRRLGAGHVLSGSLRWAGREGDRRLRASVRLVRVNDGIQVWSDVFDRALDDPLAVQSDIALGVARGVGVAILGAVPETVLAQWDQELEERASRAGKVEPVMEEEQLEVPIARDTTPPAEPAPVRVAEALEDGRPSPPIPEAGTVSETEAGLAAAETGLVPTESAPPDEPLESDPASSDDPGMLRIEFASAKLDGRLRILAGEKSILDQEFHGRKAGLIGKAKRALTSAEAGSISAVRRVPRSTTDVLVVVEVENKMPFERQVELDLGDADRYKIEIEVDDSGEVDVRVFRARRSGS